MLDSQQCVKDNKALSGCSADQEELQKRRDYGKEPDSKPQRRAGRDKGNKTEQHPVRHCPVQKEGTETWYLEACGNFAREAQWQGEGNKRG